MSEVYVFDDQEKKIEKNKEKRENIKVCDF